MSIIFKILFDMSKSMLKCLWFFKVDYMVNVYVVMFNLTIVSFQISYTNLETQVPFNLLIMNLISFYGQVWLIPWSLDSKCKGHRNHVFVVLCRSIKKFDVLFYPYVTHQMWPQIKFHLFWSFFKSHFIEF